MLCAGAKITLTQYGAELKDEINTGAPAAPSGTFRLALTTKGIASPGSSPNPKRRRAKTRRDPERRLPVIPLPPRIAPAMAQRVVLRLSLA